MRHVRQAIEKELAEAELVAAATTTEMVVGTELAITNNAP
jgi:hypothetical protein